MKLVRDCIPEIIKEAGKECKWRYTYGEDEHLVFLRSKMEEETQEFIENPSYEEAADMIEVIKAFCHLNKLDWEIALTSAVNKQETHGSFIGGVVLEEVT